MKIRYIFGSMNPIEVQSEFVPLIGDYVSLIGCNDLPNDIQMANVKVVRRTYSVMNDTVIIGLNEETIISLK